MVGAIEGCCSLERGEQKLQPGMAELETACEIEYLMRLEGAEGNSFNTAVFPWSLTLDRSLSDRLSTRKLDLLRLSLAAFWMDIFQTLQGDTCALDKIQGDLENHEW
jgi:hypothetical protein